MNKGLLCIFFVAFIIVLLGHQYAAIAEDLPINPETEAEIARLHRLIESPYEMPTEKVAVLQEAKIPEDTRDSEKLVSELAEEQNRKFMKLRGVPINQYIKPEV